MSTARVALLGIGMDAIYQFMVLKNFYPVEALIIAILLAVVPYFSFAGSSSASRAGGGGNATAVKRPSMTDKP